MTAIHPPTSSLLRSLQIVFVGEIVSVNEYQPNVVYKVDNCTGPLVDGKKWLDNQELEAEPNLKAECR